MLILCFHRRDREERRVVFSLRLLRAANGFANAISWLNSCFNPINPKIKKMGIIEYIR